MKTRWNNKNLVMMGLIFVIIGNLAYAFVNFKKPNPEISLKPAEQVNEKATESAYTPTIEKFDYNCSLPPGTTSRKYQLQIKAFDIQKKQAAIETIANRYGSTPKGDNSKQIVNFNGIPIQKVIFSYYVPIAKSDAFIADLRAEVANTQDFVEYENDYPESQDILEEQCRQGLYRLHYNQSLEMIYLDQLQKASPGESLDPLTFGLRNIRSSASTLINNIRNEMVPQLNKMLSTISISEYPG